MNTNADKTPDNKSQSAAANSLPILQNTSEPTFQFVDNRAGVIDQKKLRAASNNSLRVQQLKTLQEMANNSKQVQQLKAAQALVDKRVAATMQMKNGVQVNDNATHEKEADGADAAAQLKQYGGQVVIEGASTTTSNAGVQNKAIQNKNNPPPVNFARGLSAQFNGPVAQLKWIDDGSEVLVWDGLIDGVLWHYVKETGEMFYKIVSPAAIKLGNLASYQAYEAKPQAFNFWQQNSVLDLDIARYLDPTVITPDKAVKKELAPATGMEAQDKRTYLGDAKALETEWGSKSIEQRAQHILMAVNKSLTQTGAPPVTFTLKDLDADSFGSFSESEWNMELNSNLFKKDTIDGETMAQVADTVFHEARHAEQFFRIARLLAGMRLGNGEIQRKMVIGGKPISSKMIAVAMSNPLMINPDGLTTEIMEALDWYQSFYGAKSQLRIQTILSVKAAKLQAYQLKSSIDILRMEFGNLKFDAQMNQMDKDGELEGIKSEYQGVLGKLKELGDLETLETKTLGELKIKLAEGFKAAQQKYSELAKAIKEKQLANVGQQQAVKAQLDLTMLEFDKWQDLYTKLPEELDAWRIGESVQNAYKLLV